MNVEQLVQAIASLDASDALQCKLTLQEWKSLAPYLSVRFLKVGDPLMHEGDCERELFILADGELQVSILGNNIATLKPGTVVGEGTFFSGAPRSPCGATLAASACLKAATSSAWMGSKREGARCGAGGVGPGRCALRGAGLESSTAGWDSSGMGEELMPCARGSPTATCSLVRQ